MKNEMAKECTAITALSDEDKMTFPEVVRRLAAAGIELYYADLLAPSKTYYSGNTAYTVRCSLQSKEVADRFNLEAITSTIRQIQSGQIQYQEFVRKIMASGVICYMVFVKGRKAIYFGKHGEQHVEEFPK